MTNVKNVDILNAIEALKLEGSLVCIHSSLKSFGYVDGGADAIIRSFLNKDCTILAPGFTYDYSIPPSKDDRPQRNAWDYDKISGDTSGCDKIFSVNNNDISKEDLGVIPYKILQMPERKRGYNPIDSFTALGSKAVELVSDQSPSDVWAPLRKLYTTGGFVVLIDLCVEAIKKDPMITHCDNPNCERCNDAVQGGPILMANF